MIVFTNLNKEHKKHEGFTLVELIVVVTVIGILATISVVSFGSYRVRAENTKTISSVTSYVDAIKVLANDTDSYPTFAYACLGPTGTVCGNVTDSTTPCFGHGPAVYVAGFGTAIKSVNSTINYPSTQSANCGGKMYGGALYNSAGGGSASVYYYLKGSQTCSVVSGSRLISQQQSGDVTICGISLPTL